MFKVGDKVIAIKSDGYINKDETYIVKHININHTKLMLLIDIPYIVIVDNFISIKEQRKQKLNKIMYDV